MTPTPEGAGAGGEFDLIGRLAPFLSLADGGAGGDLLVGHGDDAAVLELDGQSICVTVDVLVEDVHFRSDLSSLADVGWKAVAVNCSDVAAMGGTPTVAVVGLCRPAGLAVEAVEELYAGMHEACGEWGLRLVGGDTVRAEALALSVTVIGSVEGTGVTRGGARVGDRVLVVGALGAAAAALALDRAGLLDTAATGDAALLAAHRRPRALVAAGRALAEHGATALIDCSDGLGADLGHVAAASGVALRVDEARLPVADGVGEVARRCGLDVPRLAFGGGEDFALLATVPAQRAEAAAAAAGAAEGVAAAVVGEVVTELAGVPRVLLRRPDGTTLDLTRYGHDHYAEDDR